MYDAIIVGAGPAGSSAAIYCNKLGLNTLLLDKSIFPRDKICGDALSGKSVKILEELDLLQDLDKLDGAIVNRIIFGNPNHSECELHLNKSLNKRHISHGFVIPRKIFDNYLFKKASDVSNVVSGFNVEDLIYNKSQVIGVKGKSINGEQKKYFGNIVLGADGPYSIISRKSGLYNSDMNYTAVGLRCYYENVEDLTDQIELHYVNETIPGYFWIFPAGNKKANIGVGLLKSRAKKKKYNLQQIMKQVINSKNFKYRFKNSNALEKPKGWNLPFGNTKRGNHGNGFLLLGDAAGLVDPFTGEGIGNAMESGKIAADIVLKAKKLNNFSNQILSEYDKVLWEYLGSELKTSTLLLKLAHYRILLNFVIDRASRNKNIKNMISGMLANEVPKTELSNPMFYLKTLFS
ncbi:geranylgeranyl reductase family protein [bacterium]|jgi:geranylgeranyl reductase family protein|nr:geranylgeranyl reductase family protein [bacterium]MBT4926855.1 geranylgeranyl reductase family protein [bacterium]MBT6018709.1 geranylgeranyl reductase family protein [bacterium]MBT6777876.1 geranylgeranyl reductase family protein [bacterium]